MIMDQRQDEVVEDSQKPAEATASEQVSLVIEDLRALVTAEMQYYRSRLDYTRHVFRSAFLYGAIAAFALIGAAIAFVLGLVLTLAPLIGPLGATLVVTFSFLLVAVIFGWMARKWMRKVYFPEMQENVDDLT
jgi:Putative Actinobacterial Holin-X, holin superfamily III